MRSSSRRTTAAAGALLIGLVLAQTFVVQSQAAPVSAQETCTASSSMKLKDQDYDDDQLPWRKTSAAEVVIYFETADVTPKYAADMEKGVTAWDASPCIQPRLVARCPSGVNCITVSLEDSNDDDDDGNFDSIERNGFTIGGHITYYTEPLAEQGPVKTLNVVIHEMGHAVGLRHRKTKGVLMHGDTNKTITPDATDYHNLLVLYGKQ